MHYNLIRRIRGRTHAPDLKALQRYSSRLTLIRVKTTPLITIRTFAFSRKIFTAEVAEERRGNY
jgi:hypothetical protein